MPAMLENTGSTTRDFCMLERNLLSHLRLALLLSLLSSSLLLHARLVPSTDNSEQNDPSAIPLASLQFAAAMASVLAGMWEYYRGFQDLRLARAFLTAPKPHLVIMGTVAGVVFGTCVVLVIHQT